MGLLTNPSLNQRNRLALVLTKHNRKVSFGIYIAGLVWFLCLARSDFSHSTYMSENALSPGLVYSELKQDSGRAAQMYLDELKKEREKHKTEIPYTWIQAKMKQMGLETHIHNFTLNYPLAGGKIFRGKNIYGILRAQRLGSTESLVFCTPYRPPNSVHTDITAGVPLLLAFAEFARKKNYWAKDLIFLVTEMEQLGIHAWLEAYYEGNINDQPYLKSGNLPARAGAIQAALNLEIQDFDADTIDIKLEGLNGQLPNLDMFNLVQRITVREGLPSGYKNILKKKRKTSLASWKENFRNILAMITNQANGVPTGNHGHFHKRHVESLTLEAYKQSYSASDNRHMGAISLLKTIEGISRSLNNLLEQFHQSYFFYILVQNDRFLSISNFMPSLGLMVGPLFIKAFLLWLSLNDTNAAEESKRPVVNAKGKVSTSHLRVLTLVCAICMLSVYAHILPLNNTVNTYFTEKGISTPISIFALLIFLTVVASSLPFFIHVEQVELEFLHIVALLALGSANLFVGLLNFALGFLVALVSVPLAIFVNIKDGATFRALLVLYMLVLNPMILIYLQVFILSCSLFPELLISEVIYKAFWSTMDAVTYGLVDSVIYGNWLYTVTSGVFFPIWTLFWSIIVLSPGKV